MKTKIKRFSKSTVSILLSLMMLFSCVVTSGAVTVQPDNTVTLDAASENAAVELDSTANADEQPTEEPVALENEKMNADIQESGANVDIQRSGITFATGDILYLRDPSTTEMNATTKWADANAKVRVYFYGIGEGWSTNVATDTNFTDSDGNSVYYVNIPAGTWTNIIVVRKGPADTGGNWNSKWGQTTDISLSENCNYLTSYCDRSYTSGTNNWSTFQPVATVTLTSPSSTSVTTGDSVTCSSTNTVNSTYSTASTVYKVYDSTGSTEVNSSAATVSGSTITFHVAGTYKVKAALTYTAKGFSTISSTIYSSAATITVNAATTTATGITVAAKYGTDGTTFGTSTTVPTVTITGDDDETANLTDGNSVNITGFGTLIAAQTFTITENDVTTTYEFTKWTSSGSGIILNDTDYEASFYPAASNEIVTANYTKCYNIYVSQTTGGTISVDKHLVRAGGSFTVTADPDDLYGVGALTVTAGQTSNTASFTNNSCTYSPMPASNITVSATFTSNYKRIYFYNRFNWANLHCYYWGSSIATSTAYPGDAMTYYEDDLYYMVVPNDVTHVIVNSGRDSNNKDFAKTRNIAVSSTSGEVVLVPWNEEIYTNGTWRTLDNYSTFTSTYDGRTKIRIYFKLASKLTSDNKDLYVFSSGIGASETNLGDYRKQLTRVYDYVDPVTGEKNLYFFNAYATTAAEKAAMPNGTLDYYNDGRTSNYPENKASKYILEKYHWYLYDDITGGGSFRIANDVTGNSFNTSKSNSYTEKIDFSIADGTLYVPNGNYTGESGVERVGIKTDTLTYVAQKTLNTPDSDEITVYAKTGTIRDNYDKYARLATVAVSYTDNTAFDSGDNVNDKYYRDNAGDLYNKLVKANVKKNKEFQAKITIKAAFKDTYKVEAFIVNGQTVYPSSDSNTASGEYICKYTISDKESTPIEITPVYFYKNKASIMFYVEDFESVKSKWGNTLAVYAWYDNDVGENFAKSDPTNMANLNKPVLGGYPGQPMIYNGGSYYMQIPKTDDDGRNVMGVTLNNLYWDDVHRLFASNESILGTRGNNCQTYDYDDFAALVDLIDQPGSTIDDIIFTFKYGNHNNTSGNSGGNVPATYTYYTSSELNGNDDPNKYEIKSTTVTTPMNTSGVVAGNGFEALTDYYGIPVGLFCNRLERTAFTSDNTNYANLSNYMDPSAQYITPQFVESSDCHKKLSVVSDGYVTSEHDYIGYFATKWYIYDENGAYVGALPPSAFYDDSWTTFEDFLGYSENAATYKYKNTGGNLNDESNANADAWAAWQTYLNLKNNYKQYPVVITYETDMKGTGRIARSDEAFRGDGRWFYSKTNEQVTANVVIEFKNSTHTTWTREDQTFAPYYRGPVTTAEAYFTNNTNKDVSLTVDKDDNDEFTFTADLMKIVDHGNGSSTVYKFVGWYYTQGAASYKPVENTVYNPVTESVNGSRPMISNATFIARYEPVDPTDEVTFIHLPYSDHLRDLASSDPAVENGTGKTSIRLRILDSSNNQLRLIQKTDGFATLSLEELTSTGASKVEVILYNEDVHDWVEAVYRDTGSAYNTIYGTSAVDDGTSSSVLTDTSALTYVYPIDFFVANNAINTGKHVMYYYSNYKKASTLTITHKLLESLVTADGMTEEQKSAVLETIKDEDGNLITPHHDFFSTQTKITVKIIDTSNNNTVVATPINGVSNTSTLEGSALLNYLDSKYKIQIELSTITDGNEYKPSSSIPQSFGFYNKRTDGTLQENEYYYGYDDTLLNSTVYNDSNSSTIASADYDSTTHTYSYSYSIPVTALYSTTTNNFVVDSLDFLSDPFKRITAEVKYYDRDVSPDSHSKPTDINKTATTVTIPYDVSYKNTIAGFNSEAISPKFSEINNILDEHYYWITQSAAVDGIAAKKDYHASTNKSTNEESKTSGNVMYGIKGNDVLQYHTDYYGRTSNMKDYDGGSYFDKDGNEHYLKWVSYTYNGEEVDGSDKLTSTSGFENINGVTIWCYNKPKEYSFTAYYVPPILDNGVENINATTLVLTEDDEESVTVNGTNTHMYIVNPEEVDPINEKGFYNQRLGILNNDDEIDGHTEYLDAYGITNPYFGITGCDDYGNPIDDTNLTGLEVKAVKYAKDSSDATVNAYEFDGWYIRHESGYQKISSERFYQNRVVSNIVLYAGYRAIPQTQPTNNVGVAVSLNGVDHYVDENNVRKVRFNTQFNIFGDNVIDDDPNIQNVAAIYMTMPTKDASDNPIDWKNDTNNEALRYKLISQQSAIRTKLQTHQELLQNQLNFCDGYSVVQNPDNSETRKDWYHTYTYPDLATDLAITGIKYRTTAPYPFKIDWYAYEVVSENPDKTNHKVTLTNKNRIQFYKVFDEATYEKTPIIAYVAVKYAGQWYISDNFVSNITYKHKGNEIYFPDYVEDSTGVYSNLETPFTEFLNQDMFKRSYEDEIGLEDNGVYIDFTNDYEEELPLDVLLE